MKWLFLLVLLAGCAPVSTYDYTHGSDGSTTVHVESTNEIENMKMGINRETGTLEVEIGGLTKESDTVEVINGVRDIVGDVVRVAIPDGGN